MRIVIAEKEPNLQMLMEKLLPAYGKQLDIVAQCTSTDEAIRMIGEYKPDLVLLDTHLPKSGALHVLEQTAAVPSRFILVSKDAALAVDAFRYGVFDYLLKPLTAADLALALERIAAQLGWEKLNKRPGV